MVLRKDVHTGQRRRFTEEYRRDAASIVIDTGQTITAVAGQLGLGEQSLGKWVAKERACRDAVQSVQPAPADSAAEIARLRRLFLGLPSCCRNLANGGQVFCDLR